jgi:hypothetical protein
VSGGPPGGGRAKFENSSRPHPRKFGLKRFLAVRRSWRGSGGGLFLGYLLRKKFIGSRGEAPPCLDPLVEYHLPSISWRWQHDTMHEIVEGFEVRGLMRGRSKIGHGASRFVQWPGCAGVLSIVPPRGMHWLGGSSAPFSTALTSRSNACCAWGWISSSCGNVSLKVSM